MTMGHVEIWTKPNCSYCTKAKKLLKINNVDFTEKVLGVDFTKEILLERFPQAKTFPVVVVEGYNIGGYERLEEMITTDNSDTRRFLTEDDIK